MFQQLMELVSKILADLNQLMQLTSWEDFTQFCCHEDPTHMTRCLLMQLQRCNTTTHQSPKKQVNYCISPIISPPSLVLCSWQCCHIQSRHSELHRPQRAKKVCDQDLVRITSEQILSHTNCGDANSFGANSELKQCHTKTWLTIMITMNKSERLCIDMCVCVCTHSRAHRHMPTYRHARMYEPIAFILVSIIH